MEAKKWRVGVVAYTDDAVVLVQGTNPDFPDRWYLPKGDAKNTEGSSLETAQRIFSYTSGIRIRKERFRFIETVHVHYRPHPKHMYAVALEEKDLRHLRTHVGARAVRLIPRARIASHPRDFALRLPHEVRLALKHEVRPPVTEAFSSCGNGHVGQVGTTCTQDGCGLTYLQSH